MTRSEPPSHSDAAPLAPGAASRSTHGCPVDLAYMAIACVDDVIGKPGHLSPGALVHSMLIWKLKRQLCE